MTGPPPILKVGLTGGIASGKTTVAGFFRELGAFLIDADDIAHRALGAGGSARDAVVAQFGDGILGPDGEVDRPTLARIVFSNPEARIALNSIVHPRVREEVALQMARCVENSLSRVAILDAALLVETGYYRGLDRLIVLRCRPEVQQRRLEERDELSAEDARARIEAQAPLDRKLEVADYVIDTDIDLGETRGQVERVWNKLLRDHEARFGEKRMG